MMRLSLKTTLVLLLLPIAGAVGYEWYPVPLVSGELPNYEIQFAEGIAFTGTEIGVHKGYGLFEPWEGMGLEYPGIGARSILYREGVGWIPHVINVFALPGATGVALGDLDGSNYADIVVASMEMSNSVGWFANPRPLVGVEEFWEYGTVDPSAIGAREVCIGDLDGDFDLDIVAALRDENIIVWYENSLDQPTDPWIRHVVGDPLPGPRGVFIADINDDGFPDIVAGSMDAGTVVWIESPGPDNPGNLWITHYIDTDLAGVKGVFACDIDLDGDLDIVAAGRDAGQVVWYEQLGITEPPIWEKHIVASDLPGAVSVWCGNLIGDSAPEIAVTAKIANAVVVYQRVEDTDVWEAHWLDDQLLSACPISGADVDGDGWTDVIAAGKTDGEVAWYGSPGGEGVFWQKHEIAMGVGQCMGLSSGDLDNDGDADVVVTSLEGQILWLENDIRDIYCAFSEGSGMCESDGVYRWNDMGQEWEATWWCMRPYFIQEHPILDELVFCGNHEGLFVSENMIDWIELGAGQLPDTVLCVWVDPHNDSPLLAGTAVGLYRSLDGGMNWEPVEGVPSLPVWDIELVTFPGGTQEPVLMATAGHGTFSDGLFVSENCGVGWERIRTVYFPTDLLQDYAADHDLPVMFVGTQGEGILRIDVQGNLIGKLNDGLGDLFINRMRYDPYIDMYAIYACTEGGLYFCDLLGGFSTAAPGDLPSGGGMTCSLPNPSYGKVAFSLCRAPAGEDVDLRVFDLQGREIWSRSTRASGEGSCHFDWDGRNRRGNPMPAGVYFYRFESVSKAHSGKVVLLR